MPTASSTASASGPQSAGTVARPKAAADPKNIPNPVPGTTKLTQKDRLLNAPLPFKQLPGIVDPPAGTGMARYTGQKLSWSTCEFGECATVLAPMDYARPDYKAITLQLARKKSTSASRVGSLLMNPGGPGGPGRDMPKASRYDELNKFDLVGWDTRGAGASTPVVCYKDQLTAPQPELDKQFSMDQSPDTPQELKELQAQYKKFAQACAENSGEYLRYIGTAQTVQDMDLMRQLLGDKQLNFLGYSYGTYLGSYYATTYPDKVGRMVLDSTVNVTTDETLSQAIGFDRALWNFAGWVAPKNGPLGSTPEEVVGKLKTFLDGLDSTPIGTKDKNRQLTQSLAATGILTVLYGSQDEFSYLEKALIAAYKGDGTLLMAFADAMNGRQSNGTYEEMAVAFPAIYCSDNPDAGSDAGVTEWDKQKKDAPFFGFYFGPGVQCAYWPVKAPEPKKMQAPKSATKILIVGGTGDPATPYEYAKWMADALGNAEMVTYDGFGHGSYGGSNACLNKTVREYLQDGTIPPKGTVCTQ